MNKCHVSRELSSYLDNQLPEKRKLEIEKHLQDCKICTQELSKLKLLSEKLKAWQAPDLGPEFDGRLKNEIVLQELQGGGVKMKNKTLAILVPSGVVAAILLFAFLGVSLKSSWQRGVQSRMRESTDQIGQQWSPGRFNRAAQHVDMPLTMYGTVTDGTRYGQQSIAGGNADKGVAVKFYAGQKGDDNMVLGYDARNGLVTEEGRMLNRNIVTASNYDASRLAPVSPDYGDARVIVIQPVLPATGEGDKIIRTAEIRLEVEDGKETYKKANAICQELGGYLANSSFYKDAEGREVGNITLRIPKDKFLTALDKLSALGKVEGSSTNSQDVSQEYANIKARLDAAMVVYTKTLEALQKKQTTIPDAIRLESELTPILQRVEDLKNQLGYLTNAISFTTVNLYFHEPQVSAKILNESKNYIKQSLLTAGINGVKFLAGAIPVAITVVIWLVVIVGVAFFLKYWIIRLFKRG